MKRIALLILANLSLIGSVQAQKFELREFFARQNIFEEMDNFVEEDETLGSMLDIEAFNQNNPAESQLRFETNCVQIVIREDLTLHIADYSDGTRIVTALDGPLEGLQVIGFNGKPMAESRNVQWHKGYFIHFYPGGKVTSYPNKQISELY